MKTRRVFLIELFFITPARRHDIRPLGTERFETKLELLSLERLLLKFGNRRTLATA